MTDIRIRKIDIDDLRGDKPPTWGRVTAIINGVEVVLGLNEERIGRVIDATTPVARELLDEIKGAKTTVVEIKRPA